MKLRYALIPMMLYGCALPEPRSYVDIDKYQFRTDTKKCMEVTGNTNPEQQEVIDFVSNSIFGVPKHATSVNTLLTPKVISRAYEIQHQTYSSCMLAKGYQMFR